MKIEVKHGKDTHLVEVADNATLGDLKAALVRATNVPSGMQKLMGKPNLKDDAKQLADYGIKDGTKLMLIGSSAKDVVEANADVGPKTGGAGEAGGGGASGARDAATADRAKKLRNLPDAFWKLPPFGGMLCDAHVEGKGAPVEGGSPALSLAVLDVLLARINALGVNATLIESLDASSMEALRHPFLALDPPHRVALAKAHNVIRKACALTEALMRWQKPEHVVPLADDIIAKIDGAAVGEFVLVPTGWVGLNTLCYMYLLIKRTSPKAFRVTVINTGGGLEYHAAVATADKVKFKTCIDIDDVPSTRLLDPAFWFISLGQWLKAIDPARVSEYCRAEVMYDVLLPWLAERTEDSAAPRRSLATLTMETAATAPATDFHTAQRSESSATKGALTALKYILAELGVPASAIRMIKFALRYEAFVRAAEELQLAAARCDETRALAAARTALSALGVDGKEDNPTLDVLFGALGPKEFITTSTNVILKPEHFSGKVVALYFSASWCPPCRRVTPLLVEAYNAIQKRLGGSGPASRSAGTVGSGTNVEFIFISNDKKREEFDEYAAKMPFCRATYPPTAVFEAFDVHSLPTLMIFGPDGQLITKEGVAALMEDPEAAKFPGAPWTGAEPFTVTDVTMLSVARGQLAYDATKKNAEGLIPDEKLKDVVDLIAAVERLVDAMPKVGDDVRDALAEVAASTAAGASPDGVAGDDAVAVDTLVENANNLDVDAVATYENANLLANVSRVHYYGKPFETKMPQLGDLTKVQRATSMRGLRDALKFAHEVVESLWARARYSGTSSRVAVQMQLIEFITWIFSAIVPVPTPAGSDGDVALPNRVAVTSTLYHTAFDPATSTPPTGGGSATGGPASPLGGGDMQMEMLSYIYKLMLSYTTAWQAVEVPTRSFDAERALISMTMLAAYDALVRNTDGSNTGFMLAFLLSDDGGYHLSTTLTKSTKTLREVSARMELTKPFLLHQRAAVLTYFETNERLYRNELFDLRMPDKFEIRKYSHTVNFLRKFLENCGYEIMARADSNPMMAGQSEMETLMGWLCDPRSPLAKEHPEFGMLRDMVLLAKFLATMEMRDAQLLRKKKELDEWATWRISFDEDAPGRQMSAGWRTSPKPPVWELMMVRGRDMDIADISVKGFGDRELAYGEGLVLQSPIDVSALLGVDFPTEDDILHAKTLPTFGDVLSVEESEVLLSCLTVTYMRIPLVLDFFATNDRHTYLFSPQIQAVLRATLFEPGEFLDPRSVRDVTMIPLRLTAQQKRAVRTAQLVSATAGGDDSELLGTPHGILLNELIHSPASVLQPLRAILRSISELGPSSVYSMNASYVLFLTSITCDVLRFVQFLQKHHLGSSELQTHRELLGASLRELVTPLMGQWLKEAEENDDTPTLCVVHTYQALLLEAMIRNEAVTATTSWSDADFSALLGSCAFVRARHGFGMGMMRTQLAAQEGDNLLTPEEKLMRFLQAQGLDTRRVTTEMLEHGRRLMMSGGRRRAVFVHIRSRYYNDTVRVPNLIHADANSTTESKALKLPPCDVPENALFALLQEHHASILQHMISSDDAKLNSTMKRIIGVVLKEAEIGVAREQRDRWVQTAIGVFNAPVSGLIFHVNTCELFWRNDELKPVPDSMSHFSDYETILGKNVMQCGLVARTEHRHWVHVVGTPYDLVEWDAPDPNDQGVHQPLILRGPPDAEMIEEVSFEGVKFSRPIDIDDDVPWPVIGERWAVEIITAVLKDMYPMPQEMKYRALLPERVSATVDVDEVIRVLMNDGAQYEDETDRNTWKEMVVTKNPRRLMLYNLVPHARKMYRSLVYTTDQQFALHSLAAIKKPRSLRSIGKMPVMAGEPKKRVQNESTLEIIRMNETLGGNETYVPARLLQGLLPSALLENFLFWHGEDDLLRGYTMDDDSESSANNKQWFGYTLEVLLPTAKSPLKGARVIRRHDGTHRPISRPAAADASSGSGDAHRTGGGISVLARTLSSDVPQDALGVMLEMFPQHSVAAVRLALQSCKNDPDRAAAWLDDPANAALIRACNPDSPVAKGSALSPVAKVSSPLAGSGSKMRHAFSTDSVGSLQEGLQREGDELEETTMEQLFLLNITNSRPLRLIGSLFTKVEDASHILVWGRDTTVAAATTDDEVGADVEQAVSDACKKVSLHIIELPRLRAKFQPKVVHDSQGRAHVGLFLVDHPGWQLVPPTRLKQDKTLEELAAPFDQCLLLQNQTREYSLLVPNHDFSKMRVTDDPFSRKMLFDRGSLTWQESVPSPFYLYAVHPSRAFLVPPSLGATLYAAVINACKMQHQRSMQYLEACYVDTPFTVEEKFMFMLFDRTLDSSNPDNTPNAHAVRLKLAHAVMHSDNKIAWQIYVEMTKYLLKRRHVDADCALNSAEVIDLLKRCSRGSPIVKAQLEYWRAIADKKSVAKLTCPQPLKAGQPWQKLLTTPHLQLVANKMTRVHFKPPKKPYEGERTVNLLWEDELMADEESGASRQLGFLFLYMLKRRKLPVTLNDKNITASFATLMSRIFQLKLARWGKEAQDEGESEPRASFAMAVLAAMESFPEAGWPDLTDANALYLVQRGININNPDARDTQIPRFFAKIDEVMRSLYTSVNAAVQSSATALMSAVRQAQPVLLPCKRNIEARVMPSNTSCERVRVVSGSHLPAESCAAFARQALDEIGLRWFVEERQPVTKMGAELPFDVAGHVVATTHVAKDMLDRLKKDLSVYAEQVNTTATYALTSLAPNTIRSLFSMEPSAALDTMHRAMDSLKQLADVLSKLNDRDSEAVRNGITRVISLANDVEPAALASATKEVRLHQLRRAKRSAGFATFDWLCGAMLSTEFAADLARINPFHGDVTEIVTGIVSVMLHTNRSYFATQAITHAKALHCFLEMCVLRVEQQRQQTSADDSAAALLLLSRQFSIDNVSDLASLQDRLSQLASTLVDTLTAQRYYVDLRRDDTAAVLELDPRFLVFEFVFSIILRKRQVEMVRWFVENVRAGNSRVQQMIMGQGKTTVVGPLLALILADGKTLVTQVMPTALLEQTRNVLRKCFSVIVPKRIFTLQFDRGCEDSAETVEQLYQKLEAAEADRSLIVAAPECLKALFLKFIEQLHAIEQVDVADITAMDPTQPRRLREAQMLREKSTARAQMADSIVPILDMWNRGVLIMDEVDVLLHPLRSELNFPIGLKHPIDLSGPRWKLPIHILDAIFYPRRGSVDEIIAGAGERPGADPASIAARRAQRKEALSRIAAAIDRGFATRALQREPHLVLLDTAYYAEELRPALVPWVIMWLRENMAESKAPDDVIAQFLVADDVVPLRDVVHSAFVPAAIQLMHLARDWLGTLLPHVLAKIDRVGFGILRPGDVAADVMAQMPLSRRLMAVPFVAKDVPSRSSEFAHPDVVIGLTILAYRYEGLRLNDVRDVLNQLKQDYSRQTGPRELRPATILYNKWLALARQQGAGAISAPDVAATTAIVGTIPLSQLQVLDPAQLKVMHDTLHKLPEVIHHYLCQHIFPRTMNFQRLKVSACGHELGSSILFRNRIGFSGTPSNLLPTDLGECFYEPGSDGKIISVLTDRNVTTAEVLDDDWSPRSLLYRIATASPSYHALIDTGALITNMDNEQVARFLIQHLPTSFEGVVFLDSRDRQMVLLRGNGLVVPLSQCGIALTRRFTFFDQVHCTGIDVKQAPNAVAVVTLGKDMVFRDYAQGAYRMRGIGKGQRVHLYLIPEVVNRISHLLGSRATARPEIDVPAWLLLNAMRFEGLQFVKLAQQELANTWRKEALAQLVGEVHAATSGPARGATSGFQRSRRFDPKREIQFRGPSESPLTSVSDAELARTQLLRLSIAEFREEIAFPVANRIDAPTPFTVKMRMSNDSKPEMLRALLADAALSRLASVLRSIEHAVEVHQSEAQQMHLNTEVVHEQEAEEEQEQEAEQEEQRVSAFSRDDEQYIPWDSENLKLRPGEKPPTSASTAAAAAPSAAMPSLPASGPVTAATLADVLAAMAAAAPSARSAAAPRAPVTESCFYACSDFQVRPQQPKIAVPASLQLSDNFFKRRWSGLGDRRLRNCIVFVQWLPMNGGSSTSSSSSSSSSDNTRESFYGVCSLAEGETIRWLMHHSKKFNGSSCVALRFVSTGSAMDATSLFTTLERPVGSPRQLTAPNESELMASLWFRYFNNDMFYTDAELEVLERCVLSAVPLADRIEVFLELLRLRRRHRNQWEDAPIGRLFTTQNDWKKLRALSLLRRFNNALAAGLKKTGSAAVGATTLVADFVDLFKLQRHEQHRIEAAEGGASSPVVASGTAASVLDGVDPVLPCEDVARLMATSCRLGLSPGDLIELVRGVLDEGNTGYVALSTLVSAIPLVVEATAAAFIAELEVEKIKAAEVEGARGGGGGAVSTGDPHADFLAESGMWQCGVCTYIQTTSAFCEMCQTPNPRAQPGSGSGDPMAMMMEYNCPEGHWVCSPEHGGCTKINPNSLFYCEMCDKARPNLSSMRF